MPYPSKKGCSQKRSCSAPLCLLDEGSLKFGIWYPDEPICRKRGAGKLRWIQNQKKIQKRVGRSDRYFTFRMLNRRCTIRGGITGLNPDKPLSGEKTSVKKWLQKHPIRGPKYKSEKEKKEAAERMREGKSSPAGHPNDEN